MFITSHLVQSLSFEPKKFFSENPRFCKITAIVLIMLSLASAVYYQMKCRQSKKIAKATHRSSLAASVSLPSDVLPALAPHKTPAMNKAEEQAVKTEVKAAAPMKKSAAPRLVFMNLPTKI